MERLSTTTENHIDPVCGMEVDPGMTRLVAIYQGHSYWFCADDCREAFEDNPQKYLEPKPAKRKGLLGRYLERLTKQVKDPIGGSGSKCH